MCKREKHNLHRSEKEFRFSMQRIKTMGKMASRPQMSVCRPGLPTPGTGRLICLREPVILWSRRAAWQEGLPLGPSDQGRAVTQVESQWSRGGASISQHCGSLRLIDKLLLKLIPVPEHKSFLLFLWHYLPLFLPNVRFLCRLFTKSYSLCSFKYDFPCFKTLRGKGDANKCSNVCSL